MGTVQFGMPYGVANKGGQVSAAEAARVIATAREASIDTIDTAIGYGHSERYLGQIGMTGFRVVTKLPALPHDVDDVANWAKAQIDASLARLNVRQLYGVLLHRPSELLGPKGLHLFAALCRLKERIWCKLCVEISIHWHCPSSMR